MGLALGTAGVVLVVLLWELARPTVMQTLARAAGAWQGRRRITTSGYDPGRERRAEQRARELLRSCVSEREGAVYTDLGVLQVEGPVRPPAALDAGLGVDRDGDHPGEASASAVVPARR